MSANSHDRTSRRDFVKNSSVAALGAGVLGDLTWTARVFAGGSDTIRVGLIGSGDRGAGAAVNALSTSGDVQLVAMADAFEDRLETTLGNLERHLSSSPGRVAVDPQHRFVGFDAYQKVIDSDVDLVILTTPPGFRPIHFEAAARAGKHVFMEKPVATDAPGVRRILEANKLAEQKNLKVGVGLQRHHDPSYLETIERTRNGEIGDVLALRVYWNDFGVWEPRKTRDEVESEMEYQMRNWYYYTWLSGDHIVEQHIHNLDVGNWVKGAYPVRAAGMGGREVRTDKKYGEIFDHHCVEYEFADGSRMFSQCRQIPNTWPSVSEHAAGSEGIADISGGRIQAGGQTWRHRGGSVNPFQIEHDDLFAAIRQNLPFNEAEYGAYSTLTAIMGRMATYAGKMIEWEEALNSNLSLMPGKFAWDADPPVLPNDEGEYPIPIPGLTPVV